MSDTFYSILPGEVFNYETDTVTVGAATNGGSLTFDPNIWAMRAASASLPAIRPTSTVDAPMPTPRI